MTITPITSMPMQQQSQEENCVEADNHTLFWETQEMKMEPLLDSEGNTIPSVYEQVGGYTIYKLFIGDFMETGKGLQKIINKLQQADPEDILELHISSNGGSVDELLDLYNVCNTIFHDRIATFANHAYSAGAWAFLFGKDRVLYEHSSLMWHSYSAGFGGKRQDLLDHIQHEDKRLEKFLMKSLRPYFTKKEIKKMNKGKDFWLDTKEACKRGICNYVYKDGDIIEAKEYLESLKRKKKKEIKNVKSKKKKKACNRT